MYPQQTAYDRGVMFAPDGRLFQVEYAREAVKKGATSVGMVTKDSIVFVAHKNITAPLTVPASVQKIFRIDSYIGVTYSGIVADGLHLINIMRSKTQTHRMVYNETESVESISRDVSEELLLATQYGGIRPYAISVLIGGIDKEPRLYEIDPGATVAGYKADAIGTGKIIADEMLTKEYSDDISTEEALALGVKIIKKVADKQQINENSIDIATITRKDGFAMMSPDKVSKYL
ncbi:MAG: archaeal proteasome endopeptidase complex subunit alpha [Candidatus Marsarchaeota archaeon]|jgi:proteasome alpha subunit|nr:archaeal proteasome endopeptidase complex subunit alpha [Candidatus Marsarchaeota archaeon]MCL5111593.1 archaeal proteasome endopeptidase complex subunit alpha [Candidatus Marsarchaeota archaeon]